MKEKNLKHIKFDNKTIAKISVEDLDFSFVNKIGDTKFKRQIIKPFDVGKKSITKGLKLCIQKDIGSKLFWLSFWFEGKNYYYHVGKFIEVFEIKEVEDKLLPIDRSHTNDSGHWIKNPKITDAEVERVIKKADIKDIELKTVN